MRVPDSVHGARDWRIHEVVRDFTLEDVWALPVRGEEGDFRAVVEQMSSFDPARADSRAARVLWQVRDVLGRVFGLGRVVATAGVSERLPIPGTQETSLSGRLPGELQATARDVAFEDVPFVPLYLTRREFAAEISNGTVHGVLHLGWVDVGDGEHQAHMAVYVKPRGLLGRGYMQLIRPFRHHIVYPALLNQVGREWANLRR